MLSVVLLVVMASTSAFAAEPPGHGAQLYQSYCAACHGSKGHGNGVLAPYIKVAPPDLSVSSCQSLNGSRSRRFSAGSPAKCEGRAIIIRLSSRWNGHWQARYIIGDRCYLRVRQGPHSCFHLGIDFLWIALTNKPQSIDQIGIMLVRKHRNRRSAQPVSAVALCTAAVVKRLA